MEYNRLGRSNLMVSKICLGTMHFGPRADEATSHAILDRAFELGINFIDTANVYGGSEGFGRSEEIIGAWFAGRPEVRDQVVLATKQYAGQHPDRPNGAAGFSAYRFRQALIDSLRRLQTDRVDLYQTHHIDRTVSVEEFWGTYERAIAQGDVLYAGSSNFSGWGLAMYQLQAWQRGGVGFVSEQTQYNLLSRVPEMEVLPAAQTFGLGVFPWSPLGRGVLTGQYRARIPKGSRAASDHFAWFVQPYLEQRSKGVVEAVARAAQGLDLTPLQVALLWVRDAPGVTAPLLGARTAGQLAPALATEELTLPDEIVSALDDVSGGPNLLRPSAARG